MQAYPVFRQQADRRILIYIGNLYGRSDLAYALQRPVSRPQSFRLSIPIEFKQCGDHQ